MRTSVIFALTLGLLLSSFFTLSSQVQAKGEILGIHILGPGELPQANALLDHGDDKDKFVTVPFTLGDLEKKAEWQKFFDECHRLKIRPLLRLVTRFEHQAWAVPTKGDIVKTSTFLSSLEWHRPELTVILFNEPNHAKEWGGAITPTSFAEISLFGAQWFNTEAKTYTVLPAAMDLAADGRNGTMEAFSYWKVALAHKPELLEHFDAWNSHSYPNPAFAAAPTRIGQNSLRGYENELAFLKTYTQKEFPVYITETGWNQNALTDLKVKSYYTHAFENIWSKDERIVAVTPFLLQGAPGTFAPFSFLDKDGKPTVAYDVYRDLLSANN